MVLKTRVIDLVGGTARELQGKLQEIISLLPESHTWAWSQEPTVYQPPRKRDRTKDNVFHRATIRVFPK